MSGRQIGEEFFPNFLKNPFSSQFKIFVQNRAICIYSFLFYIKTCRIIESEKWIFSISNKVNLTEFPFYQFVRSRVLYMVRTYAVGAIIIL